MSSNVAVPELGESISEATLLKWLKQEGEQVAVDEPICELESDKATVELPAPAGGILHQTKQAGETAQVGEVIARIDDAAAASPHDATPTAKSDGATAKADGPAGQPKEQAQNPPAPAKLVEKPAEVTAQEPGNVAPLFSPPAIPRRQPARQPSAANQTADVRRVPLSKIRRRIAERLVQAQQTAAMLTTFNEIDMTAVQDLRHRHGERFAKLHGVSLGLTSFFARAAILALKQFPELNASLEGDEILYHQHVNLAIAVSTDRGLVVPVLHAAEAMSFPKIEQEIKRTAAAAREGKLSIEELSGGTFTITNGGVFGSLLSTPILNPPQTGILGMHAIQDRPVAIQGQVVIRPMMYVALTYDHRLVDGQQSVSFLVRVKQLLEDPMQMVLEI